MCSEINERWQLKCDILTCHLHHHQLVNDTIPIDNNFAVTGQQSLGRKEEAQYSGGRGR